MLARRFGTKLVYSFFEEDRIDRFQNNLEELNYVPVFLTVTFALPGFPDGALVYLAGSVTKISVAQFMLMMPAGRGISLLVYSVGIDVILRFIEHRLNFL